MSREKEEVIVMLKKLKIVDKSSTLSQLSSDYPGGNIFNKYKSMSIEDCVARILRLIKAPRVHKLFKAEDRVMLRYTTLRPYTDSGSFIIRTSPDEYTEHGWYESD